MKKYYKLYRNIRMSYNTVIASWNINSIRNKIDYVNIFLNNESPDILFLSETKLTTKIQDNIASKIDKKFNSIWNTNKTSHWHGTCIIYRKDTFKEVNTLSLQLKSVSKKYKTESTSKTSKIINETSEEDIDKDTEKAHNDEGRFILCEFVLKNDNKFVLLGTYSPNSGVDRKNPLKRLAYRTLRWDIDIYHTLNELKKSYDNIIWVGDLNVARKDNDISYKIIIAGTTQEERDNFENFITNDKWIDTFDNMYGDIENIDNRCTYGYGNKLQLRLDYIICSEKMENNIEYSKILYESSEEDNYIEVSDHLPIIAKFIM